MLAFIVRYRSYPFLNMFEVPLVCDRLNILDMLLRPHNDLPEFVATSRFDRDRLMTRAPLSGTFSMWLLLARISISLSSGPKPGVRN
jgi:hypothetical protein